MRSKTYKKSVQYCNRLLETGLCFLIFYGPLRFGCTELKAYSVLQVTVCGLVVVWMIKLSIINIVYSRKLRARHGTPCPNATRSRDHMPLVPGDRDTRALVLLLVLFLAWIVFQLLPLPPAAIKFLSPATYDLYCDTLNAYDLAPEKPATRTPGSEAIDLGHADHLRSLSINQHATCEAATNVLIYVAVFMLVIGNFHCRPAGRERHKRRSEHTEKSTSVAEAFLIPQQRLVNMLIAAGFIVALVGILQRFSAARVPMIYWKYRAAHTSHFGPYYNRNHFAGYVNMIIPLILAVMLSRGKLRIGAHRRRIASLLRHSILAMDTFINKQGLPLVALLITVAGLFLSASRGGILSFMAGAIVFLVLLRSVAKTTHRQISVRKPALVLVSIVILSVIVIKVDLKPVIDRFKFLRSFSTLIESEARPFAYLATAKMALDFPIFGVGFGAYRFLYFKYRSVHIAEYDYKKAHNDYLQLTAETGLPGLLIVLAFIILYYRNVLTRCSRLPHLDNKLFVIGGCAGLSTMVVHSAFDFNMQVPANAMTFFILLALVYNASHSELHDKRR